MADLIDVTNIFPFNKMEKVRIVVDFDEDLNPIEQDFIFCPNTYVKTENHNGHLTYFMNEKPLEGYHIHPAFVTNGQVNEKGVLWGVDIIEAGVSYNDLVSKAAEYNSAPYNIYDHHFIARLMLYQCGDTDCQLKLGGTEDAMGVTWQGINDVWGGINKGCWLYGIDSINDDHFHILSNQMDNTMVNSYIPANDLSGYATDLLNACVENFNACDLFIMRGINIYPKNGILGGDFQSRPKNAVFSTGYPDSLDSRFGPFSLCDNVPTSSSSKKGMRLRRPF